MTDEKQQNSPSVPDESKMIKEDPAFDPSWDLKAAQTPVEEKKDTEVKATQPQAVLPSVPNKPEDDVPQFIKEQKEIKTESSAPAVLGGESTASGPEEASSESQSQTGIAPLPAPIETPKKEIKKKSKIVWGDLFSTWVLVLGVLLIVVLLGLFAIAKLGLLHVPFLTDWVYRAPLPERYVISESMSWAEFRGLATERLTDQGLDSEPPIVLRMTEQEFTGLLNGVIDEGLRTDEYKVDIAQVVFLQDSIELYFFLSWKDFFTFEILTHMVPIVEDDGTLRFEVVDARLGDLPIPGSWVLKIMSYFFARDMGVWKIVLSNGYGIQSTDLSSSVIQIFIGPVSVE